MTKLLIALITMTLATAVNAASWKSMGAGVVGVVSEDTKTTLVLSSVTNEQHDTGVAFYYYPDNQPKQCDVEQGIYKQFTINGKKVRFKKFCMDGALNTAYTPMQVSDASILVSQLVQVDSETMELDGHTFSTVGFTEQVEKLLGE